VDLDLVYHAVTVFNDELICAADSMSSDYGSTTTMLLKTSKLQPSFDNAALIKDHLTNTPTILRVMHGGLQVAGQSETFHSLIQPVVCRAGLVKVKWGCPYSCP